MNQKTIAKLAGVSSATVSRVINGAARVSPGKRARVERAIAEHGYVTNTIAQSLRVKRTKTIGFVVPDIGNPFFPEVLRGVQEICVAHGYHLILGNTDEDRETERRVIQTLCEKRVDGMIVILVDETGSTLGAGPGAGPQFPAVTVDRHIEGFATDSVLIDNVGGMYAAARHLLQLGHQRIAIIHGPRNVTPGFERLQGFLKAAAEAGLEVRPEYVREGDFRTASGHDLTQELLQLPEPPTAILGGNNLMTIGAFAALREAGVAIPDQISLIGFDDFVLAEHLNPPLTVVDRPMADMGRVAAELLLARIDRRDQTVPKRVVLPTKLKIRASCRRVR